MSGFFQWIANAAVSVSFPSLMSSAVCVIFPALAFATITVVSVVMVEIFGEPLGCRMFRKVAPWYAKRFGPANEFNKRVVTVASRAEFLEILDSYRRWRAQFLDETGELKPGYRPAALVASFMQEPAAAQREQIPVPKGPVEVW